MSMKFLSAPRTALGVAFCSAFLCAGPAVSADAPATPASTPVSAPATGVLKGTVLEARDVEVYTYLRLKTREGEIWAAVNKTPIKKGAEVTIENAMLMQNFESKSLKKTFPKIVFGTLGGAAAAAGSASATSNMMAAHAGLTKPVDVGDVKVAKASGPDARTVAEIVGKRTELKDKNVLVRGKVVKYTASVMDRNWIHLRDGTGADADNSNDLVVTTKDNAKLGDVVVIKGVVRTDKDFGAGYAYKVLVEDATLQK